MVKNVSLKELHELVGGSLAQVLSLRARCSYSSGNITGATRLYEESLRRDPDNTAVARGLKKVRSLTKQCVHTQIAVSTAL